MDIPHISVKPGTVLYANASNLTDCLVDGFSEIQDLQHPVRVVYGDYAALSLLRAHAPEAIESNALWGAKLVEHPEAPDHTYVIVGEVLAGDGPETLSSLVVQVRMVFH